MGALSLMRTNGLAPLISAIQDPQYPLRIWAVTSITYMPSTPTSATITTPLLIQCLSDTANSQVPLMAAIGLGRHNSAPQLSIPALTRCLETPGASELLRGAAVQSLGLFGAQATNALPALTNALADASLTVRRAATNALQQITSEPPTNTPAP
jgi:HEAT repeat protein